jgi:hypothetical protein
MGGEQTIRGSQVQAGKIGWIHPGERLVLQVGGLSKRLDFDELNEEFRPGVALFEQQWSDAFHLKPEFLR